MKLNLICEIHREFFTQEISECAIDYLFNIFSTSKMADSDFHLKNCSSLKFILVKEKEEKVKQNKLKSIECFT